MTRDELRRGFFGSAYADGLRTRETAVWRLGNNGQHHCERHPEVRWWYPGECTLCGYEVMQELALAAWEKRRGHNNYADGCGMALTVLNQLIEKQGDG